MLIMQYVTKYVETLGPSDQGMIRSETDIPESCVGRSLSSRHKRAETSAEDVGGRGTWRVGHWLPEASERVGWAWFRSGGAWEAGPGPVRPGRGDSVSVMSGSWQLGDDRIRAYGKREKKRMHLHARARGMGDVYQHGECTCCNAELPRMY